MAIMTKTDRRIRRFELEGSPRERKRMDLRRSEGAASGRGRKWTPDSTVRRSSRPIKRMLARQARAELRRVARLALHGVEELPDVKAIRPRFSRELI